MVFAVYVRQIPVSASLKWTNQVCVKVVLLIERYVTGETTWVQLQAFGAKTT